MFKTILTTTNVIRQLAFHAKDARTYRKEVAARLAEKAQYDAMIAESQAKIGPYKPATIPVQVWA